MPWTAHIDGGSRGNPGPAGAGVEIRDPSDRVVFEGGFALGRMTNNQAEYSGLLAALEVLSRIGASDVLIISDSELMVRQLQGRYRVKSPDLRPLYEEALRKLEAIHWDIRHTLREGNARADALANQAMDAGVDIVLRDELMTAELAPSPPGTPTTLPAPVKVTVVTAPAEGACPARLMLGQTFQIAETTPAGLCLRSCSDIVSAVLSADSGETVIPCRSAGCGAIFRVTRSGSG